MPLYKRPDSPHWHSRISIAGQKTRQSTGTDDREQAEEFEQRERERLWRLHKLGDRGAVRWKEVAAQWLAETSKRSVGMDQMILDWLDPLIGEEAVSSIDRDSLEELRKLAADEGKGRSTIDRYMALVRAILNKCVGEWQYLPYSPKVPMYKAQAASFRWLTQAEFQLLFRELPPHQAQAARFAVLTGLRMRSQLSLTWDRIDFHGKRLWIPGEQMKAGRSHGLPLSQEAVDLLKKLRKQDPDGTHVFTYLVPQKKDSKDVVRVPIKDCNTAAFKKAVERAGLAPLRWHDLRHTFATWAVQNGVTLHELMKLGDWKSYAMVLKYAHMAPDQLATAASKLSTKRARAKKAAGG